LEAVPFDIPSGDLSIPKCLDNSDPKYTLDLVDDWHTRVSGLFEMIDNYAKDHGCHDSLDFNAKLFSLKSHKAETVFKISILASAIL